MKYKDKQGFTLIELLVVMAIIGLIASVVMVAVQRSRINARNANRKQDAASLRKAMEFNYNAQLSYPNGGTIPTALTSYDVANLASFLVPTAYSRMPVDPSCPAGGACNYRYAWTSVGGAYALLIRFGNEIGGVDCQIRVNNMPNTVFLDASSNPVPDCNY